MPLLGTPTSCYTCLVSPYTRRMIAETSCKLRASQSQSLWYGLIVTKAVHALYYWLRREDALGLLEPYHMYVRHLDPSTSLATSVHALGSQQSCIERPPARNAPISTLDAFELLHMTTPYHLNPEVDLYGHELHENEESTQETVAIRYLTTYESAPDIRLNSCNLLHTPTPYPLYLYVIQYLLQVVPHQGVRLGASSNQLHSYCGGRTAELTTNSFEWLHTPTPSHHFLSSVIVRT